jgi:hypothetical protein
MLKADGAAVRPHTLAGHPASESGARATVQMKFETEATGCMDRQAWHWGRLFEAALL